MGEEEKISGTVATPNELNQRDNLEQLVLYRRRKKSKTKSVCIVRDEEEAQQEEEAGPEIIT